MYFEQKVINGELVFRTSPDGEWCKRTSDADIHVEEFRAALKQETFARHSDMCIVTMDLNQLRVQVNELSYEIREIHSRVRREAIFLRAFFVAVTVLWAASRIGVIDQVAAFMLGLSIASLALYALKESQWGQRKIRNVLIWWNTLQIQRGKH